MEENKEGGRKLSEMNRYAYGTDCGGRFMDMYLFPSS